MQAILEINKSQTKLEIDSSDFYSNQKAQAEKPSEYNQINYSR